MIKAVYFDIDNTICNYDEANAAAMEKLYQFGKTEFSLDQEKMKLQLSKAHEMILKRVGADSAVIHNRLIRFQCFLELLQYRDFTKAVQMDQIYWDTFMGTITLEPGLAGLLSALQKSGILLGIGSDQSSHIQYRKLEALGILSCFSRIVTSEEAGVEKPAAGFFRLCVEKAGCLAEECAFIGDHKVKDVEGALRNGLHGIWYHPKQCRENESGYPVIHTYADCMGTDGIRLGETVIKYAKAGG